MKVRVKVLCVKTYEVDVDLPKGTKDEIEQAALDSLKTDYNEPQTVDYQVEGIVPC
jgi:hypothetical protein